MCPNISANLSTIEASTNNIWNGGACISHLEPKFHSFSRFLSSKIKLLSHCKACPRCWGKIIVPELRYMMIANKRGKVLAKLTFKYVRATSVLK